MKTFNFINEDSGAILIITTWDREEAWKELESLVKPNSRWRIEEDFFADEEY